ncbi:hypothetical protein NA56DRAFT_413688 [Hyaloscypha hepaticicola]|uniref:Uncharacterized protein n=1 Tax=Hyaloscypha hepaticicola TaxID=2082293 RepID=A0A2J6PIJ1_9HELO|nr:hypothetical protein NA56DRAFT_413688 [Hyaloscypha hepaticicola]
MNKASRRSYFLSNRQLHRRSRATGSAPLEFYFSTKENFQNALFSHPHHPLRQPWNCLPSQETAITLCKLGTSYAVYKNSGIFSFSFKCFIISYFLISLAGVKATRTRVRVGRHPVICPFGPHPCRKPRRVRGLNVPEVAERVYAEYECNFFWGFFFWFGE